MWSAIRRIFSLYLHHIPTISSLITFLFPWSMAYYPDFIILLYISTHFLIYLVIVRFLVCILYNCISFSRPCPKFPLLYAFLILSGLVIYRKSLPQHAHFCKLSFLFYFSYRIPDYAFFIVSKITLGKFLLLIDCVRIGV